MKKDIASVRRIFERRTINLTRRMETLKNDIGTLDLTVFLEFYNAGSTANSIRDLRHCVESLNHTLSRMLQIGESCDRNLRDLVNRIEKQNECH